MQLLVLASLKSAGQASRLETQGRVAVAVLSLKAVWRWNFFLWEGGEDLCFFFFFFEAFDYWIISTHIIKATDLNINHILKIPHSHI